MRLKKLLCLTLAAALTVGTVGCGKKNEKGTVESESKISAAKDMSGDYIYTEDPDFAVNNVEGEVYDYTNSNGYLYIFSGEWFDTASGTDGEPEMATPVDGNMMGDSSSTIYRIYKVPETGGDAELLLEETDDGNWYMDRMLVNKDGELYVTKVKYSEDDRTLSKMYKLDNGQLTDEKDISKITDVSGDSWLSNLMMDDEGNLVAFYDKELKIFDKDLNEKASVSSEEYFDASGITKDGDILVIQTKYEEEKSTILGKILDKEKGAFGSEFQINGVSYINQIIRGSGNYDFFYKSNDSLCGYNIKENKAEKIVDMNKSDMNSDMIGRMSVNEEGRVFAVFYDESSTVMSYLKADASDIDNRTVLTIMSVYGNYELKQKVLDYNKSQSKYRINLVDYSDSDDPAAKISAEIAAGNLPDMFDLNTSGFGNMSMDQCISKGLFTDLNELIDKDPDFSMDDLVPAVRKCLEKDGKVYYLATTFSISTLMGKASEVGEEPGWTFEDMKSYVETKDEDTFLFWSNNKMDMLRNFLYSCSRDFVDWKKGEVSFDSPEFKAILEMSNRGINEEMEYNEDTESEPTRIRNGKLLFMEGDITPDQMQMYSQIFDNDICYKGYPSKTGSGTYLNFGDCIAISAKSENKEAAWDFISEMMSEEYQGKNYTQFWGAPSRQDVFDEMLKSKMIEEDSKDKYGNDIYPITGSTGWDDFEIEMKPLTEKDVEEFKKIVDQADGIKEMDENLTNIITEEAEAYFKGDKSVDEVAGIIQNRASTYVNENK